MSKQAQEALTAQRGTNQVLFWCSLLFTLGAVAAGIYTGKPWWFLLFGVVGGLVSLYFGVRLRDVKRDMANGGIVIERCYVQSCLNARSELLFVKTPAGSITLSNATQFTGEQLAHNWVLLEYARNSRIAFRAEFPIDS